MSQDIKQDIEKFLVAMDFAVVESRVMAVMIGINAVSLGYVDGKPVVRVLDVKQIYGTSPDLVIFDDFVGVSEQQEPYLLARKQANRKTKEAKKPLPYYHGHKRRF